jgi:hypothetical protein
MSANEPGRSELARALRDPTSVFATPDDVVAHRQWTREERRRVLEQWKLDAERLDASASENMAGGEPARLGDVLRALRRLGED